MMNLKLARSSSANLASSEAILTVAALGASYLFGRREGRVSRLEGRKEGRV
jgi:hypothetical protein